MDDLAPIAAATGGYLMRHHLLDLGYSDASIRIAVRRGTLVRLRHGTYSPTSLWHAFSPAQKHRALTFSVLDRLGSDAFASHQSAGAVHQLDLFDTNLELIHITRLDTRPGRREAGVVYHHGRVDPDIDIVEIDGRRVSSPMRAVFEIGSNSSTEAGVVLASSALRRAQFTKPELVEFGQRFDHWLGARRARLAIRLADGRLEPAGEARSLHMMWRHRIPHPELQWVVTTSAGIEVARTDFAWIGERHTGEFDGLIKYGRLNPYINEPGEVLTREKVREDLIRAEGLGMSRWTWRDLAPQNQAETARMIVTGIERSRRIYAHNAVHIPLG